MKLLKKYIVLAFTLLSYSINAFGISFDQYEQYDHEKAAIYQTYHFEQLPNFIAEFVTPGIQLNADSYSEGWHINGDLLKKEKNGIIVSNDKILYSVRRTTSSKR